MAVAVLSIKLGYHVIQYEAQATTLVECTEGIDLKTARWCRLEICTLAGIPDSATWGSHDQFVEGTEGVDLEDACLLGYPIIQYRDHTTKLVECTEGIDLKMHSLILLQSTHRLCGKDTRIS